MTAETKLITAEELAALPAIDGRRELLDGRVVEMAPANARHNNVMNNVDVLLTVHVRQHHLGTVLPGDTGIILRRNPDHVRGPDVCFFAAGRLPEELPEQFLEQVPDLVVEIVSPTDSAAEVLTKTEEWLQAGARLVWTLYPKTRSVVVSEPGGIARTYQSDDTLTGGEVLPGFAVRVAELFEA